MKKKILSIFGTRPEAIKMAPIVVKLSNDHSIEHRTCVTSQHREMLDQVLEIFAIKPDYDLDLMKQGQDLSDLTSQILISLKMVLEDYEPDMVLVHGDTSTTMAASLAAFYKQIPIAHVEAGLRTYNKYSPWPEEVNRCITSTLAQYHFAPTTVAENNLLKENIPQNSISVTGNSVIDALYMTLEKIKADASLSIELSEKYDWLNNYEKYVLITAHRRENMGIPIKNICDGIKEASYKYKDIAFVFPVHLNPNIRAPVFKTLSNCKNIYLLDPLNYLEFSYLMAGCYFVITDSGGVQEEAPSLGKPVLVLRDTTERPEALSAGTIRLIGTSRESITENIRDLVENSSNYQSMSSAINPYGDGYASDRIIKFLKQVL